MATYNTLADGQVAASATAILTYSGDAPTRVSAVFTNVGGLSETLVLTFKRQGGTARRIFRRAMVANEQLVIAGLPMSKDDVLLAATSNASSVDYVVNDTPDANFSITGYDATGAIAQVTSGTSGNLTVGGDLVVSGGDIDAGASGAAGSVDIFPSTASKGKLSFTCTDQTGDTTVTVNAAAMAAARSISLPDPLAAADILLGKQAAVARTATADGLTTGTIADGGRLQHVTVTSANADHIIVLPTPTPGTIVVLHNGATGYELRSSDPATIAINGGTGAGAESAIAADSTAVLICVSATAWKGFFLDADSDLAKVEAAA